MNLQQIEGQNRHPRGILEIHSIFYTIQGEGPFSGCPAIFIRLAGCNLQCPGCDTDYTSERHLVGPQGLLELLTEIHPTEKLVVITGGEPFRQNLTPAVEKLLAAGYHVQLESNGTLYQPGFPYDRVTLVVSPKTAKLNKALTEHRNAIHSLKYVAEAGSVSIDDGLPILALGNLVEPQVARPPAEFSGRVYLHGMDSKDDDKNAENQKIAVDSSLQHGYTFGIQLHKLIGKD